MSTPLRPELRKIPVSGLTGRLGKPYLPDLNLLVAANVALTLQIPLLLTGEAGCGKTELAWAVASWMHPGVEPIECAIHSDSRARDLLYRYDAERRFGDAQHGGPAGKDRAADARHYVELRGLGLGLMAPQQRVVLIDEIDKAPRDLPNDLLRELDAWRFEIPELGDELPGTVSSHGVPLRRDMRPPPGARRPLVIITSNIERRLPEPFLRRCAFFHIGFPGEARLREIVRAHHPDQDGSSLDRMVRVFVGLRDVPGLTKKPATSELLTWANALLQVFDPDEAGDAVDAAYDALVARQPVPWWDLPGLFCLLKLVEDQQTVCSGTT